MTIRAHITQRFWADVVEVFIVDHQEGQNRVLYMDGEDTRYAVRWEEHEHGVAASDIKPSLILPYDSGRALLQALVEHYQGAEDTRALRRDYDAERKRVDEHTKTIADIARILAGRSVL